MVQPVPRLQLTFLADQRTASCCCRACASRCATPHEPDPSPHRDFSPPICCQQACCDRISSSAPRLDRRSRSPARESVECRLSPVGLPRSGTSGDAFMPVFALFPLRVGVAVGVLLTAGASALSAQDRVGINSAVNPEATGALPGATARRLVIGQDVIFNEHITTSGSGQTQLLFLDESSMSIGPNSDLTIDQFVYYPKSSTGKLAMNP